MKNQETCITLPEAYEIIIKYLTSSLLQESLCPTKHKIEIVSDTIQYSKKLLLRLRLTYGWENWIKFQDEISKFIDNCDKLHSFCYPLDCGMSSWQYYEIAWIYPFDLTSENLKFLKEISLTVPLIRESL